MSIPLTVSGTTYNYPEQGQTPSWGQDATNWALAITNYINNNSFPTDIPLTLVTVNNNQVAAANVQGLLFDVQRVRGAFITYTVYRSTVNGGVYTGEFAEVGTVYVVYKNGSATWELGQTRVGTSGPGAGVTFSITAAGQVQYTSDNMTGAGTYTGQMRFSAKTISQ